MLLKQKLGVALLSLGLLGCVLLWLLPVFRTPANDTTAPDDAPLTELEVLATAFHEVGHVVASMALRPKNIPRSLTTYAKPLNGSVRGEADIDLSVRPFSRQDALSAASAAYAGVIAERLVAHLTQLTDFTDSQIATWAILVGRTGKYSGTPIVLPMQPKNELSAEEYAAMMADSAIATSCAQAIIHANIEVIAALADVVLAEPVVEGRRFLDEQRLSEFFSNHPVVSPLACDF